MKSKLSKLHNHFVNEDPITKMMFDAFPDDLVVYGGAIIDWWIGNPHTIDYDVALLNDRWEEGVEFLTSHRPNQNIWQFKEVIVPQKNYFATYNKGTGKATKLSKGHLPWIVMLEQKAGYDIRFNPGNRKWMKPYIGLSKLNRKDAFEIIDGCDTIPNRIAITKTEVIMRDERPLECYKWRTFEFDGWCNDPQHAIARSLRYQKKKGFYVDDKIWKALEKLMHYREETQDVMKPEGFGKYQAGDYLRIDLETNEILDHMNRGLEIPKRYRIDYHYNDSGMIKE